VGEVVRYEREGRVAQIVLDRPPLNAYDTRMRWELEEAWWRAAHDAEARVVVLRAEGKHFCAGADIKNPGEPLPPDVVPMRAWELMTFVRNLPKPTIAVVQGACVGGGQAFVFPCDLIFCSDDARFRDPLIEMGFGGIHAPIHTWMYGPRLAKEMLFRGAPITAQRLYEMGAVNGIHARDVLVDEALRCANEIAGNDPSALQQAKRAVDVTMDLMGQHDIERCFAESLDQGWTAPTERPSTS
jgi:enoyl-CoA hydratase/carnithine racemase